MKNIKIVVSIAIIITIFSSFNLCYGANLLDTIFGKGNSWFNGSTGTDQDGLGQTIADYIKNDVVDLVERIGNLAFFVIAAFLGVKYIWSGVSGKSEVKETLPTFVVGAMFFYSADLIYKFSTKQFFDLIDGGGFNAVSGSIWSTVIALVQILSIAGIIAIGLKYMFSAADTKADIKKDLLPMVIGLIFVYSIAQLIPFIADISGQLFKVT